MFEIGFLEICLIGIIALLVIGPEKLPRVARTVGLWVGKARGAVKTVKYEIDEQLRMEELKQSLQTSSEDIQQKVSQTLSEAESSIEQAEDALSHAAGTKKEKKKPRKKSA
jgi:sec-independent protein translocase protein TatB